MIHAARVIVNVADAWWFAVGNSFATGGAVFKNQSNGIFGHVECFVFIPSERHDFRQRRDANGKSTLLFGFKDNSECPLSIHQCVPFTCVYSRAMVWIIHVLSVLHDRAIGWSSFVRE